MSFKKRKPPVIKGKDAKRFLLRKEINEVKMQIRMLNHKLSELEDELKKL